MGGKKVKLGASGKFFSSDIDGITASGIAGDAGIEFSGILFNGGRHAFVVKNIGSPISYITKEADLPLTLTFGNSLSLSWVTFSADVGSIKGTGSVFSGGMEIRPVNGPHAGLAFRGGYTTRRNDADKLSGFSFGMGLRLGVVRLDYAWVPYGELGDTHAMSLVFDLSKLVPKRRLSSEGKTGDPGSSRPRQSLGDLE